MRFFKLFLGFLIELWPLAIAGLLYLATTPLKDAFLFPSAGQFTNYEFMIESRRWIASFTLCILPVAVIFIGIWVGVRIARKAEFRLRPITNFITAIGAIGILVYANQLMCLQSFGLMTSRFGHSQTLNFDNHTYHVDSIWKIGVGRDSKAYFVFFACDNEGKICQNVFDKLYHLDEIAYEKMSTALIPDTAAHTVTLQINGEAVYVHHPQ